MVLPNVPEDQAQVAREELAGYYAHISALDACTGALLSTLESSGIADNTIFVFTSDHGEGLASHRWTGKMMYYEEEAAVPLIVSFKGVTPAGRIDREHLVSALDVLPTICDYAGVKGPAAMRGQSLRPIIEKPQRPGHEYVVSEMARGTERSFMVRTKRYKYMVFPGTAGEKLEMLFDMQADPGEMKNLAGRAAFGAEMERHRKLLAQWNKLTEEDKHPAKPSPKSRRKNAQQKKSRT